MSIYCSTFSFDVLPYDGSHVMPSRETETFPVDVAYPAPHIPTRLEAARGRTYVEAREDGQRHHPWLRFSFCDEANTAFVIHEREARALRDFLDYWLKLPKVARTG